MYHLRFAIADFRFPHGIAGACLVVATIGAYFGATAPGQTASSPAVVAIIPVGRGPAGVAVDPRTNTIVVANSRNYGDDSLAIIDGSQLAVVGRIADVGSDVNADAVAFDPATGRFYVSAKGGELLAAVDSRSRTIVASISTPAGPGGFLAAIAPHPGTVTLYAMDWSGYVYALDLRSLKLKATIPLPSAAREGLISIHPDGHRLYASHGDGFLVIGAGSGQIEARVPLPISSILAVDSGRSRLYGANGRNTLYVIDGTSNQVVATVRVGNGGGMRGRGLAFNPTTGHVFVANPEDGTVSVVDGGSARFLTTLAVGRWPNRIAVNPSTNRIYVTNRDDGTVSVIEDR